MIEVISAHAEGEVGDVIIGGVDAIPGKTIWEQSRFTWRKTPPRGSFKINFLSD